MRFLAQSRNMIWQGNTLCWSKYFPFSPHIHIPWQQRTRYEFISKYLIFIRYTRNILHGQFTNFSKHKALYFLT
jgi:hypothetical protein